MSAYAKSCAISTSFSRANATARSKRPGSATVVVGLCGYERTITRGREGALANASSKAAKPPSTRAWTTVAPASTGA